MLAELSPKNPLQLSVVEGSLQAETGISDGLKDYSGFVTAVLSPVSVSIGGWRVCNESTY